MVGAIIVTITILACLFGFFANSYYQGRYYTPAVHIGALVLQCVFMLLSILTLPNPDVTGWFIFWTSLLIISYASAIFLCKQQCLSDNATKNDTVIALMTQAILPLGVALLIIVLIVLVTGGPSKKKR